MPDSHRRPVAPTAVMAVGWLLSCLLALGIVLLSHPPVPEGPIFRTAVTTEATR